MSFQGLISGSECAVPSNPLSQVLKHTEGDRSLQQDRSAGPSSARLHQLPSSAPLATTQQDAALARQFFSGTSQNMVPPPSFMPSYAPELSKIGSVGGSAPNEPWVLEQPQQHF
ncbi:hypothetical protein H0H92_001626, partial [Tricholoma furcatifolium]